MLQVIFLVVIVILTGKIIMAILNINFVRIVMTKKTIKAEIKQKNRNILILIPVLREQAVIIKTMNHFRQLQIEGIGLYIAIAGTIREKKVDGTLSTKEVVSEWINTHKRSNIENDVQYYFFEANDQMGDRATQLNFAVNEFITTTGVKIDLIGVYDADSLPSANTLCSVIHSYEIDGKLVACQQPVQFVDAANEMSKSKANPVLVANAIYQSTWSMIRELPSWIKYYEHSLKSHRLYKRNVYLIGHGEFLTYEQYLKFKFPEHEVTDGIQLGYRLSMSNKPIKPILDFCSDDVPHQVGQLIQQHKRWFGGCMRLIEAYSWSKNNFSTKAVWQLLDGFWSQFCWAWASLICIFFLAVGAIYDWQTLGTVLAVLVLVYCYVIPALAHNFLPAKINVRLIDWLCLPIAIAIKGIGPNLYFLETFINKVLLKKKVTYQKVERKAGSR